jgi:hypothetical protein
MYDPTKPITAENWPPNLRMPPKRKVETPTPETPKKSLPKPPVLQDEAISDGPFTHVLWSFQP